jgi:hypothetical protein
MTTPACIYLAEPPSDFGTTNAVVTNVLTTCDVTTKRLETNVLTVDNLAVLTVDGVLSTPVFTEAPISGDGSSEFPLTFVPQIIRGLGQNGTGSTGGLSFGATGGVPSVKGLWWNSVPGNPFSVYTATDIQPHISPVPLRELIMYIFKPQVSSPGNMYFVPYDLTGTVIFPTTLPLYMGTTVASTRVNLDKTSTAPPGIQGTMRYPLVTPIPANTPFVVLLTTDLDVSTGNPPPTRMMLYGVE